MSTAEIIYQHLDAFTGGIEDFLAATADESYESKVYEPFHMTVMGGRTVTFGFYKEMGGDLCPDPEFKVTLRDSAADMGSLSVVTLLGSLHGAEDGNGEYCAEFLEDMVTRKKNGIMTLKDLVIYPKPGE